MRGKQSFPGVQKLFFASLSVGEEYGSRRLPILILSMISGASAGAIVMIINKAILQMNPGKISSYVIACAAAAFISVITKDMALKRSSAAMEETLESFRNRICDQIRHSELIKMEQVDLADIDHKIVEAGFVSSASLKKIHVLQSMITLAFCFIGIARLSVLTAVFIAAFVLLIAMPFYRYNREEASRSLDDMAIKEIELLSYVHHILDGFKEIKIDRGKNDDLFFNYLKPCASEVESLRIKIGRLFVENSILFSMSFFTVLGSIVFILSAFNPLSTTFALITIILFVWTHLAGVIDALPEIIRGDSALRNLKELEERLSPTPFTSPLEDVSESSLGRMRGRFSSLFNEIALEDICFNYTGPDGETVFRMGPVSFLINAGEIVFIVGGNGSGKSTLMKVLTGLYPPHSGIIRINGKEVRDEHRSLFSAIFADFYLFDGLYGIDLIEPDRINHLLVQMKLNDHVKWSENRFIRNELSSAQRKRLALVAALMENKPVYVLDEWAAEQDIEFRKYFYETLLPQLKKAGKTIIAISHDDRYYHVADRLIKMEDGKIIET